MLEWSLMLISSCAEVERMVTVCGGKLKAPVVKQKSLELERKGGKFGSRIELWIGSQKKSQKIQKKKYK